MTAFPPKSTAAPSAASGLSQQWQALTGPLRTQWQALAPRERSGVTLAAWVLGLLIVWFVLLHPALRTRAEAPAQLSEAEATLQTMQVLALEAKALRAQPTVPPEQALTALRAATDHLGDGAHLLVQGDQATLSLSGVSPEQLQGWLTEARSAARARPLEAHLQRGPKGFTGRIVVAVGEVAQ